MPCGKGYKHNHNPFTDTSSAQIKGTETHAQRGGYGMNGTPGTAPIDTLGEHTSQGVTAGMKSAPGNFKNTGDGRHMPTRTSGGNAMSMIMRIAGGSQS